MPYEERRKITTLYRGALSEEARPVELISDFYLFKDAPTEEEVLSKAAEFGRNAGVLVDGLIRIENVKNSSHGYDPRNTTYLKVTDVFEHVDGRRNLDIFYANFPLSVVDPAGIIKSTLAYRFFFAAASIRTEYKS